MSAAHHRAGADLAGLVSLVPIGYNQHSLHKADEEVPREDAACEVLWNGGVWDYCHPAPVLHALAADRTSNFRLRLLYAPPPERLEPLLALAAELGLEERVLLPIGPVAHRARDGWVKAARAVVITGGRTAENMTCHRLRLRDAALYRLPVVVDDYGATGDLVAALGIGPVIDPTYPQALAAALRHAVDGTERERYLAALDRARSPLRGRFALERHLAPLLGLLESGHRAPDRTDRRHQDNIHTLLTQYPGLREQAPDLI
ncbi:glycosyltransferase [Streptomyces sp. SID1034]|nr:glycosyltransferase [Streptomyces sp. SID1034]